MSYLQRLAELSARQEREKTSQGSHQRTPLPFALGLGQGQAAFPDRDSELGAALRLAQPQNSLSLLASQIPARPPLTFQNDPFLFALMAEQRQQAAMSEAVSEAVARARNMQDASIRALLEQQGRGVLEQTAAMATSPKRDHHVVRDHEIAKETEASSLLEPVGFVRDPTSYVDASLLLDPDPSEISNRKTRGGVTEPFPEKLHRLLKTVEDEGNEDIISFFPHGRAFGVHKPDLFVSKIMPRFFKQSRLSSFQRQLNLYGFTRIGSGPDAGGYYHELFLKGRPKLCVHMRRVGLRKGDDTRDSSKLEEDEEKA